MDMPAHQLTMTVLMTPDTANFAGKVHGGTILKLLDQVAYRLRQPLLRALCGDAVGRPGDVPAADPRRRTGHLPAIGQLHRHLVDGGRHQGRRRGYPHARRRATSTAASSRWWRWTTTASRCRCRRCGRSPPTSGGAMRRRSFASSCGATWSAPAAQARGVTAAPAGDRSEHRAVGCRTAARTIRPATARYTMALPP